MKVLLLYPDQNFNFKSHEEYNDDLIRDLGLDVIFEAMAKKDAFIYDIVKKVLLSYENDLSTILYRQDIFKDCINNKPIVERIYNLAIDAIETKKKSWLGIFSTNVSSLLSSSVSLLKMFLKFLREVRSISDEYYEKFDSTGFRKLFSTIKKELTEEFFSTAEKQLKDLTFESGFFIKAKLGPGIEGKDYQLLKPNKKVLIKKRLSKLAFLKPPSYTFSLHPRDDAGIETLTNIRERSINQIAKTLANAGDHILEFFIQLRSELAFYMGAINLYEKLSNLNAPFCFPEPYDLDRRVRKFTGLYDVSLALAKGKTVIGNELNATGKDLFIITGANRGGKTTFLRSIGQAQILMQSGIFVPAIYFSTNINKKIVTHFYRKEDPQLESGKLDEELRRFDRIVSNIKPNSLLLLNESFSSTNEREGSEIAVGIIKALIENKIEVFYVTHLYEFAKHFYDKNLENVLFLRAERKEDGRRTFKILEGEPLPTSYAKDLYEKIFNN
ncbi:MAG TPA: DNA mismatch repair protein MutS [Clostridia bacterium]|nr:DNA mismatch repair protein MutS [Clostridia bacterium]